MSGNSWTFVCTAERFDGERIIREAKEAGFQAVAVRRGDRTVVLATQSYAQRLRRLGMYDVVAHLNTPAKVCMSEDNSLVVGFGKESIYPVQLLITDLVRLHQKLLEAEASYIRTTVVGVM